MPSHRFYLGLVTLCLLFAVRPAKADDGSGSGGSVQATATTNSSTSTSSSSTSTYSQPAPSGLAVDATDHKRPFTISATLREEYDDNIFTAKTGRVGSAVTFITPSILFDLPMDDSDLSFRDTFSADYYSNRPGDQFDLTDQFIAQYNHNFSDRFSLDVAEQFQYYTQPSLFQSIGTNYYNGAYISNTVNLNFNAQWTPLISTSTTYANTIVDYQESNIATQQNSMENTASQNIGFAILPKITLTFGGIIDDINYKFINRGYTTYTGNTGINWQALPSMSLSVSVGGSVIDTQQAGTSATPYAAIAYNWKIGARSTLNFNYSHEVVPSDIYTAEGQIADRFSTGFQYAITPRLSTHLDGILTHGNYTQSLLQSNQPDFTENDYAIDLGFGYTLNSNVAFSIGYTYSGVSSGENYRDYTRNQVYIGVTGTY